MLWKETIVLAVKYEFNTAGNITIIHIVVALFLCPWADYNVVMSRRSPGVRVFRWIVVSRTISVRFSKSIRAFPFNKDLSAPHAGDTSSPWEVARLWDDVKESSDSVVAPPTQGHILLQGFTSCLDSLSSSLCPCWRSDVLEPYCFCFWSLSEVWAELGAYCLYLNWKVNRVYHGRK